MNDAVLSVAVRNVRTETIWKFKFKSKTDETLRYGNVRTSVRRNGSARSTIYLRTIRVLYCTSTVSSLS